MFLVSILFYLIAFVSADPKGPGYEAPSEESLKYTVLPVDQDPAAEAACESGTKTNAEREECRRREKAARNARAIQRELAEDRSDRKSAPAKPADKCEIQSVVDNCVSKYIDSSKLKNEETARACELACSASTFENSTKLKGCSSSEKQKASTEIANRRTHCGTGGYEPGKSCASEAACAGQDAAQAAAILPPKDAQLYSDCQLKGDLDACKYAMTPQEKQNFVKLQSQSTTDGYYDSGPQMAQTDLGRGIVAEKTFGDNGETYTSYKATDGSYHQTYEAAARTSFPDVPVPEPRPKPPVVSGGTSNGGSSGGTVSGGTTNGGTSGGSTSGSSSGGSSSGTPADTASKASPQPAQQAQANTNSGGTTAGGTTAGGTTSGGSSSSGSTSGAFSNPFSNSNLTSGGSASGSNSSSGFQGLGKDIASNSSDEFTGGNGDGGSSYDGGGGYRSNNSSRSSAGYSEGTNRDSSFRTASDGRSVAPASRGSSDYGAGVRTSRSEELGTSAFQSGYHKASGRDTSMTNSKAKQALGKMDKVKRKKLMDRCKGNMSCIADILGRGKYKRDKRGIASTPALPSGVWSGYTDILSHMKQVHDKMPINHDGEVE